MDVKISWANTPAEVSAVRQLFQEYSATLGIDLCFQGFASELKELPGAYASPRGRLLMATIESVPAGCVALRARSELSCEMKRLYVRPEFQSHGVGRKLARRLIDDARGLGYTTMLLDTLPTMQSAVRLYESLGFARRAPYFDSPIVGNIFMELKLERS